MKTNRPSRSVKSINTVLEALQQVNHATAQEIFEWISLSPRGKEVSLTSVYRALNYLVDQSKIKPLNFNDGQVRFELNTRQMHHHHFICTKCRAVQVVDICPFEQVVEELKLDFLIKYHNFEIFGLCKPCQKLETVFMEN